MSVDQILGDPNPPLPEEVRVKIHAAILTLIGNEEDISESLEKRRSRWLAKWATELAKDLRDLDKEERYDEIIESLEDDLIILARLLHGAYDDIIGETALRPNT